MKDINHIYTQHRLFYFIALLVTILIFTILNFFESLLVQWLSITFLFFITIFLIFFMMKRYNDKISSDSTRLKEYLEDISNKKYDSILHIEYFKEYLEISVILRNIVKRLYQKDKKSSKK